MKFLVIGLGSMGRRRIRLLLRHVPPDNVCGADTSAERRAEIQRLFSIQTYSDYHIAIEQAQPDAALICTPPLSHADIISECIARGLHVFSEINLVPDRYDAIIAAAKQRQVQLFLSSTLLYRRDIQMIKDIVNRQRGPVNYRYHVGQYLPDWHPWDLGRDFFIWDKRTGGCREIFAIELPWLVRAFGAIVHFTAVKGKISALDIDYPDHYFVILEHESGSRGVFLADVLARKAQQSLLVYSDALHLTWEGTPESLSLYDIQTRETKPLETYGVVERSGGYTENNIENAYEEELCTFLSLLKGGQTPPRHTFEADLPILRLIDRIEGSES